MEWIYESDALSGDSRYVSNTDRGWCDFIESLIEWVKDEMKNE
jgi:hypothetical protein